MWSCWGNKCLVKEKEWYNRNVADWRGITTRYFFTGMMKEEKKLPIIALSETAHTVRCGNVGLYAY